MNKSESKYYNTAIKMDIAFIELLEKKDFEYITVKEICQKAQVNRSTFYLHYESIGELLDESVCYIQNKFLTYFPKGNESIANNIEKFDIDELYLIRPKYLVPYLQYIKDNKRLFATAIKKSQTLRLKNSYKKMFTHILNPILDRFNISQDIRKYMLSFYISGIISIVNIWIESDCKEPVEKIVKIIEKCIGNNSFRRDNDEIGVIYGKEKY